MLVWRLTTHATRRTAFDGAGAARYGGRWNRRGTAVVYTASHFSLAVLEVLVNATEPDFLRRRFHAFRVDVPDAAIEQVDPTLLIRNWHRSPGPESLAKTGSEWARSNRSLALHVPSAVVRSETNLILDCDHPDFRTLVIAKPEAFRFDPRLI